MQRVQTSDPPAAALLGALRRQARDMAHWLLFGTFLLVILGALASLIWLTDYSHSAHDAEVLLIRIQQLAHAQSALEWEAIADHRLTPAMQSEADAYTAQLATALQQLMAHSGSDPAVSSVAAAFDTYATAIATEFALLGQGQVDAARLVDAEQVDPRFDQLLRAIADAQALIDGRAQRADSFSRRGTLSTLIVTSLAVVVLVWQFDAMRRKAAVVAAEQETLRQSEDHFRALVRYASDIILICDHAGTVRYITPSVERILGFTPDELIGTTRLDLFHPADMAIVDQMQQGIVASAQASPAYQVRVRHRNGSWRFLEAIGTNLTSQPSIQGLVINARDITERKLAEDRLHYQAFHDPLTQLPNRAYFLERLEHAVTGAARRTDALAVIFLDLDNFKVVNDSLGHDAGDRLLLAVATRLKTSVRPGDIVARLGGDEFTVLLENVADTRAALDVAEAILAQLSTPVYLDGREIFAMGSVGVALSRADEVGTMDLMRSADIALYRAKQQGKASVVVFDADMNAQALERLALETDLRRAVERGELCVDYQPIVALASGHVVGMEALVRWEHPQRGVILPGTFVPMAEETGLIVQIGEWVLETACRNMRQWQQQSALFDALHLNVNLSVRQFQNSDLLATVRRVLRDTGLRPEQLELEITESLLLAPEPHTQQTFRELHALGVRLALDDFGTGYSSLSYLQRFPIDVLKIDRSFVAQLEHAGEAGAIIQAIVTVAHTLKLQVTAEGIETPAQYRRLAALGCQHGQGFFVAEPLPAPALTAWILARHAAQSPLLVARLDDERAGRALAEC